MFKSLSNLSKVTKREEGQGLVEYALILVLVSVVVIVVLSLVGPGVGNIFSQVTTALNGAATGESTQADTWNVGDYCVDYTSHDTWHFIWQFDGGDSSDQANWHRTGTDTPLPLCAWSDAKNSSYPPNN